MKPTIILLFLAVFFSNFKAQLNATNFKVALDKENSQILYSFNFEGTYFKVETTVYKSAILPENIIAHNTREDDSNYDPINYPPGFLFSTWSYNYNSSAYDQAGEYFLEIKAWDISGNPTYQTITLSYSMPVLSGSNLKVTLDKSAKKVNYSFNFEGTYFKVETKLYKNSVSQTNLIAYGIKEDESNYDPIVYPPGTVFTSYTYNQDDSAYETPSVYILVIKAYEVSGIPVFLTKTLNYTPPVVIPSKPDLTIGRIQIFRDKFNVNDFSHLFFDSQNTSQYPGTAFNKGTKYKFVVTINNAGAINSQNSTLTLIQGLSQSGTYPSGTPLKTYDAPVAISNTNVKTVEFYETLISPSQDYLPAYLAFHIDKNNTVDEINESNNIKIQQTFLYPTNTTIAGKMASTEIIKVFNEKGTLLKEYSVMNGEKVEKKIVEDFGAGNYYIQSENNVSRRAKITK